MTVNTAAGARLFIGGSVGATTLVAFQALTWVEVGEVDDLGQFGDESSAVSFTALKDKRTRKLKGPRDAGTMTVVAGDDPNDVGQIALAAAEQSPLDYAFKVVLNDAVTSGGNPSEHYFMAKVMGRRKNAGNVSNVVKDSFTLAINSAILETVPT